jgi:hypothetical protein
VSTVRQPNQLPEGGVRRQGENAVTLDARSAPRFHASLVPAITGVRLSPYGADATLLNISASGVLVECASRLRLGTVLTIVFDGTFSPSSVEGRVARSSVATVDKKGVLRYHVGVAFLKRISLELSTPAERSAAPPPPDAPPPSPAVVVNRW